MTTSPVDRAQERAKYPTGLMWRAGVFLIITTFFWILDLIVGQDGLQWSFWMTIFWGLALAFHALAYLVAGRQVEERKAQEYREGRGR